jgi:hypothetical protein
MNNFDNLLITLFIIFFCYILFYRIYKLCVGSKIIEGIDSKDDKNKTGYKDNKPKLATTSAIKKDDEEKSKPPSEEDNIKESNKKTEEMQKFSDDRKKANQPTPSSSKLLQARFT